MGGRRCYLARLCSSPSHSCGLRNRVVVARSSLSQLRFPGSRFCPVEFFAAAPGTVPEAGHTVYVMEYCGLLQVRA